MRDCSRGKPHPALQLTVDNPRFQSRQQVSLHPHELTVDNPFGPTWLTKLDICLKEARPHAGESSLERGDLIEISGPSGSGRVYLTIKLIVGKTTMLIFLLMGSILPSQHTFYYPNPIHLELGGRDQYASLIYPTTHPSPIPILRRRLYEYIERAITSQVGQIVIKPELVLQIDQLVKDSLGRLRVMRVKPRYKTWSLALKSLLYQKEGGMDLVVCDGFADGFWPERCNDEGKRKRVGVRASEDIGMQDVMEDIKRLRTELGSVVFLSTQGLWVSPSHDKADSRHLENSTLPTYPLLTPIHSHTMPTTHFKALLHPNTLSTSKSVSKVD
jgi:hypothetical protein